MTEEQLKPVGQVAFIAPDLTLPPSDPNLPLVDPKDKGPGAELLRRLDGQGKASGFDGILYENRDRGHSSLPKAQFPRLTRLSFGPALRKKQLDYGLAGRIVMPAIVLGNSSTALTGHVAPRSQTRLAMTSPQGAARAFLTYVNNHIYLYPEHRDHDAVDLFPANWPYTVTTQGSSFSDQPFMRALGLTLAAFSAPTKEALREKRLIAPTLQMILRRSQKAIYRREQYMSASAHPTVFDAKTLAPERMVALAASLTPTDIPPMVHLTVEQEEFNASAGLSGLSERLFDTPSAIARIWRSTEYSREMTVTADKTKDPNGRDLSFSWVLLRGDPEKVRITPMGEQGERARIQVDWHAPRKISKNGARTSHRVDIGVFAWNGVHDSAPAFLSISFPSHQKREYRPTANDGKMRLVSIDYGLDGRDDYYDPFLHWSAAWKDTFGYGPDGQIIDWTRAMPDRTISLIDPKAPGQLPDITYKLDANALRPSLTMTK